jgi:hypothetical protein
MAAGGCLLSEAAPGQMDSWFVHDRHLSYYDPDSLESGLKPLLADPELCARLGRQGQEEVRAHHSFQHRAELIRAWLAQADPAQRPGKGQEALAAEGESLLLAGLRWPDTAGARLPRALGRLQSAAFALPQARLFWLLGLNQASLQQWPQALVSLAQARELGAASPQNPLFTLSLALALHELGQQDQARSLLRRLRIRTQPGQAAFHAQAARWLAQAGFVFTPGFNRRRIWAGGWSSLEHLSLAVELELKTTNPQADLPFELGELLLNIQAPNQAWEYLTLARELGCRDERLPALLARAGREGYIT